MTRRSSYRDLGSLRVQSILYQSDVAAVTRAFTHLVRAVDLARAEGTVGSVEMAWGDGSKAPVLDDAALQKLKELGGDSVSVRYDFFGENKGTARGHNTLFGGCDTDFLLVMNPDVVMAPDCLLELARPFQLETTGLVEARQMPIEHPKDYSVATGETCWASTACCLIDGRVAREVRGFDADSFFLYCDDVDFSWRLRLAGYKVIFQPSAAVFHDKRLRANASWQTTPAEQYYSAEAALFLAHKWSRPNLVEKFLREFTRTGQEHFLRAAKSFKTRREAGTLCEPLDAAHLVGEFVDGDYARHRFKL